MITNSLTPKEGGRPPRHDKNSTLFRPLLFFRGRKSNITMYFVFIVLAIMIVLIAAVFAPFGVMLNSEIFVVGEEMMIDSNETLSAITNTTVRERVQGVIQGGIDNTESNIEFNNAIFQWSWVIIIALIGIIIFMYSRQLTSRGGVV